VKLRLNLDTLSVDSFDTGRGEAGPRGTVQAHQESRACKTARTPHRSREATPA
jgi:hypothetical protein